MSIQRYSATNGYGGQADAFEDDSGDYVLHIAHAAEVERLRGEKQTPQGKTIIVALQILEQTANDEKSSIILSAHNTPTVEEAIGAALLRHVGGNRSLGALSTASIDDLTADLPVPEEVTAKAEVENATQG